MQFHYNLCSALGVAMLAGTALGGDLNPPVGPVEGTMTTLGHIEPRVCINDLPGDATAVHVIPECGNYFLRANIDVPLGMHGVRVQAGQRREGFIVDLGDFSIVGQPGSLNGITYDFVQPLGAELGLSIHSGSIIGMGGDGIHGENARAFALSGVSIRDCAGDACDLRQIKLVEVEIREDAPVASAGPDRFSGCGGSGLSLTDCAEAYVFSLTVTNCGSHGIQAENSGFIRIRDTDSNRNDGDGLRFINVTAQAQAAAEKADIGSVRCSGNGGDGIHLENAGDATLKEVTASDNGDDGLDLRFGSMQGSVDNRFDNISSHHNVGNGMRLIFSEDISFRAGMGTSRATGNGGSGLHCEFAAAGPGGGGGGGTIRLTDSIFEDNVADGITLNRDRSKSLDMRIDECSLSGNGGNGLNSYFATGDRPTQPQFATMIDSMLHRNGNDGLFSDDMNLTVNSSEASGNHRDGWNVVCVDAHTVFTDSSASGNHRDGWNVVCVDAHTVFDGSSAMQNGRHGVRQTLGTLTLIGCGLRSNGFMDSVNPGDGLHVEGAHTVTITGTDCVGNASRGLAIADLNRDGMLDLVRSTDNGSSGIVFESLTGLPCGRASMRKCISSGNGGHGLDVQCSSGAEVRECVMRGNGGLGASAPGIGHVFVWNTCADNALGPYFIPLPGNSVGPALEEAFMMTDEKPHSNYVR